MKKALLREPEKERLAAAVTTLTQSLPDYDKLNDLQLQASQLQKQLSELETAANQRKEAARASCVSPRSFRRRRISFPISITMTSFVVMAI